MSRPLFIALLLLCTAAAQAQPTPYFDQLSWRFIGPFRGGRVDAVAGVPGRPGLGYFGAVDGGVFKTTDAGTTWQPLFQHGPVASVGAIAVAVSNPEVVYIGTGESTIRSNASYGAGVWRSDDGGQHWQSAGLDDSRHITRLLVDPANPDRVLVAALGHVWGPNRQRGVFLSTDGGKHWKQTLFVDADTGAADLARDAAHPRNVYATTWKARRTPWFQYAPQQGAGNAIWHSADGGQSWEKLAMHGLPKDPGRIGIAVTDTATGPRLYAILGDRAVGGGPNRAGKSNGVYRSDDGGAHWRRINDAARLSGRGWYFGRIYTDPSNPDLVYIPNTSLYRSTDAGAHFTAIKGSPDGDDMHTLWIDPEHPRHLIVGADQGASISFDEGNHWSSWFNQPTAQIYHISSDHQTPYQLYATQQDSGALMIPSRARGGIITNHDWQPVGGGESGWIFPRNGDPSTLYGSTYGGVILRYHTRTQIAERVSPVPIVPFGAAPADTRYYFPWNTALALSPFDPDTLYVGAQAVLKSEDGGDHWREISPTLTYRKKGADCQAPPTLETASACGYSVIFALAPSPLKKGILWAGTDDGRLWRTRDGGAHWAELTPPQWDQGSRVDSIAADPRDPESAYVAVDRHQVDDFAPHLYITHDAGRHWRQAVRGIPRGHYIRVVRVDPKRRGLLYAGTEQGVFLSFNDGRDWQSLQGNLPTASVRDLVLQGGDLIAATHGRGIWILDDIEPLRESAVELADTVAFLYPPRPAVRFRPSTYHAESRPPEVPHAANPPSGAIIDYHLGKNLRKPVVLTIYDARKQLVRRYSSEDTATEMPPANFPDFWKSPPTMLPIGPGDHRFVWDLRYTPPAGDPYWAHPAILQHTQRGPLAPLVLPGQYHLVLSVDDQEYTTELVVRPDPAAETTAAALQANVHFSRQLITLINRNASLLQQAQSARKGAGEQPAALQAVRALLKSLNGQLRQLLGYVSATDSPPNPTLAAFAAKLRKRSEQAQNQLAALRAVHGDTAHADPAH